MLQAFKLDLLPKTSSQSQFVSSLLFEPSSRSIALMLSDYSFLLYPSLSPFSSSPSSPPPTPIPPISTSACFLRLLQNPNSNPGHVLFLSTSPHAAGSAVLLRAWILLHNTNLFAPARLNFKRSIDKSSVVLDLRHGFSVQLAASVNVLILHSLAANQIWVLSARLVGGVGEDGDVAGTVGLMKCAVIDCTSPIYSIRVSLGFLVLGEVDGVRVFPLRPLIKGTVAKQKDSRRLTGTRKDDLVRGLQKKNLPNGVVIHAGSAKSGMFAAASSKNSVSKASGTELAVEQRADGVRAPCKLRTVRLRQNSGDHGSFFVVINCAGVHNPENSTGLLATIKAVSIHALSQKRFLILDSVGDLHLLSLPNNVTAPASISSKDARINRLDQTMKVQMLAVLPEISPRTHIVWISDGGHSVHMMSAGDMEIPISEDDKDEGKEKSIQFSAIQAIFTSEKVQDMVPLATNAILILGQVRESRC